MVDSLITFLQACKDYKLDARTNEHDDVVVCMGNEAGDLDSMASAVAFAYFSKIIEPSKTFLPLFQQGRHDFVLRPENVYALQQAGVSQDLILCVEDLPADQLRAANCKFALVDHNRLLPQYRPSSQQSDPVCAIIDHHQDEGCHLEAAPRIVLLGPGSCASLVTNHFYDKLQQSQASAELPQSLRALLLGAILIDTGNLKAAPQGKATEADRRAASVLLQSSSQSANLTSSSLPPLASPEEYFVQLRQAKSDIASLCYRDQFRRDYKSFTTSNGVTVGLSSILLSLNDLAAKEGWEGFRDSLRAWAQERGLQVAGVLTHYKGPGGKDVREHLYYPATPAMRTLLASLPEQTGHGLEELHLVTWNEGDDNRPRDVGLETFKQLNVKATRKQVLPALRSYIEGHNIE